MHKTHLATLAALILTPLSLLAEKAQPNMSFTDVTSLKTEGLAANVKFKESKNNSKDIKLTFSGKGADDEFYDRVEVTQKNGGLFIKEKQKKSKDSSSLDITIFGIHINMGDIRWNDKSDNLHDLPNLTITLPETTALDLGVTAGEWELGDVKAPLSISITGTGRIEADDVTANTSIRIAGSGSFKAKTLKAIDLNLSIAGAGNLELDSIDVNKASIKVAGAGSVRIDEGQVKNLLDTSLSGAGSVTFGGSTQDAKLKISGIGMISVDEVRGNIDKSISGLGSIAVGKS